MGIDYEELAQAGGLGKGESHYARGRRIRREIADFEDAEKTKVRLRDKRCRWPRCHNCRTVPNVMLHVAHVIEAKGMGKSTKAESAADRMMLLDAITHEQQERGRREVRPLTPEGTAGPCEFWEKRDGAWHLVAKEVSPFSYERD